jgi:hypothetical protein
MIWMLSLACRTNMITLSTISHIAHRFAVSL